MPDDPILRFILLFTFGGLVISALAGTGLVGERRRWWTSALLIAPSAAIVNTWALVPECRFSVLNACAWISLWHAFTAIVVAAAGRIGYRSDWPGFVRIVVCFVTDFAVRWGSGIAAFIVVCEYGIHCDL